MKFKIKHNISIFISIIITISYLFINLFLINQIIDFRKMENGQILINRNVFIMLLIASIFFIYFYHIFCKKFYLIIKNDKLIIKTLIFPTKAIEIKFKDIINLKEKYASNYHGFFFKKELSINYLKNNKEKNLKIGLSNKKIRYILKKLKLTNLGKKIKKTKLEIKEAGFIQTRLSFIKEEKGLLFIFTFLNFISLYFCIFFLPSSNTLSLYVIFYFNIINYFTIKTYYDYQIKDIPLRKILENSSILSSSSKGPFILVLVILAPIMVLVFNYQEINFLNSSTISFLAIFIILEILITSKFLLGTYIGPLVKKEVSLIRIINRHTNLKTYINQLIVNVIFHVNIFFAIILLFPHKFYPFSKVIIYNKLHFEILWSLFNALSLPLVTLYFIPMIKLKNKELKVYEK